MERPLKTKAMPDEILFGCATLLGVEAVADPGIQ